MTKLTDAITANILAHEKLFSSTLARIDAMQVHLDLAHERIAALEKQSATHSEDITHVTKCADAALDREARIAESIARREALRAKANH